MNKLPLSRFAGAFRTGPLALLALLSVAASGDSSSCLGDGSGGSTTVPNYGANGSVCSDLGVTCCGHVEDPCTDNNDCCTGNCTGSNGDGGTFNEGEGGSTCAEPVNQGCSVGLSSRCPTGACACQSDSDCCLGSCVTATIPGTSGKRCCLETGMPCDANADCCSLMCDENSAQCL